jgi:hypothetical protein
MAMRRRQQPAAGADGGAPEEGGGNEGAARGRPPSPAAASAATLVLGGWRRPAQQPLVSCSRFIAVRLLSSCYQSASIGMSTQCWLTCVLTSQRKSLPGLTPPCMLFCIHVHAYVPPTEHELLGVTGQEWRERATLLRKVELVPVIQYAASCGLNPDLVARLALVQLGAGPAGAAAAPVTWDTWTEQSRRGGGGYYGSSLPKPMAGDPKGLLTQCVVHVVVCLQYFSGHAAAHGMNGASTRGIMHATTLPCGAAAAVGST